MRIHAVQNRMSYAQADTLLYFLHSQKEVTFAKVYDRTCDAVISYVGDRQTIIELLRGFHYEDVEVPEGLIENSGRELNNTYQEKLIGKIVFHYARRWILPYPIRICLTSLRSVKYIWKGLTTLAAGKIEVPVLDATAIGVSVLRGDFNTAGSIMFMLGIGELLEEWTHKKSVDDLARTMSLNVGKVWLVSGGQEVLVPTSQIKAGDKVVVHMGNIIPFDGVVAEGEAMVNQASLTGESVPVRKTVESTAYAGTVVEEGELTIEVKAVSGSTRYEKIVTMIEDSEKLKSAVEGRAEHLADRLVPYTFLGTGLTWLLTRNVTRTLSVLMVDFSCALKLAMPLTVLTAIREANAAKITVKGGKYLEAFSEASTIVFDKTGTLTKAQPTLHSVIAFGEEKEDDLLCLAACLEEHFPHSMAKAVVRAAAERNLEHEEVHSKVEYIVAHGIASYVGEKRVVIGSAHFVFEDEKCRIRPEYQQCFDELPLQYSHLYLCIAGELAAVICIYDPLRAEAKDIHDKYIEVPYTTSFGILFLPFEGLYAEVVNAGLLEVLQRDYQVNVAGPSTMAALLNSLQMGFKTLAIQKRSGEVWQILGAVKTEFEKFGSGLQSMQRHLNQTGNDLEELIGTRSRAITRKLESVQQLEPTEAADLLGLAEGGSRISTQNSEIDRQDNVPRLRRKDDAGMPM